MRKLLQILRRVFRYLIKGIPSTVFNVNVSQTNFDFSLNRKVILITGGSKGIGKAIAKRCIQAGATVIICGRNKSELEIAKSDLGDYCRLIQFDISDIETAQSFIDSCFTRFGKIDYLVNNAGVSSHEKDFRNVTKDSFDYQFNVNCRGTYFLTKFFLEKKELQGQLFGTNILFISSERGDFGSDIPYGLTKSFINNYVAGLNSRLSSMGVRVNALAPGVTATEMTHLVQNYKKMSNDTSIIERTFIPEEMAEVAVFLLSDSSQCISGEIIHCDAGTHIKCI